MEIFVPPTFTTGSLAAFFGAGASATTTGTAEGAVTTIVGAGAGAGVSTTMAGGGGGAISAAGGSATMGASGAAGAAGVWANAIEVPASNAAKDKLANFLFMRFSSKKKGVCLPLYGRDKSPPLQQQTHAFVCTQPTFVSYAYKYRKKKEIFKGKCHFFIIFFDFLYFYGFMSLFCHLFVIFV
jgi:hypothetical protein